jgi:acetate kinase
MRVLVVNAGSSSVKLRVVDGDDRIGAQADLGAPGPDLSDQLAAFVDRAGALDAVGHRVVHGGPEFRASVVIDERVRAGLAASTKLAPLHNPPALAAIEVLNRLRPGLASVACFDTAFHADLPAGAATYALPAEWVRRWGIRRYGFHGLSCRWATERAAALGGPEGGRRLVVCHLGAGGSATAVLDGRSVDTTMGFTPVEGLVMATRPGDLDAGAISWLLHNGLSSADLDDALEHRGGLAGISGVAGGDMRILVERRSAGDAAAGLAIEVYLHRLAAKVAAMAAAMQGLDTVVLTGGIGENSATIRAEACARLGWLGVVIDEDANAAVDLLDVDISGSGAAVRTLVVKAREELVIAADCRRLLAGS